VKLSVNDKVRVPSGEIGKVVSVHKLRIAVQTATLHGFKNVLYYPNQLKRIRRKKWPH
jgi:hypothetical protein